MLVGISLHYATKLNPDLKARVVTSRDADELLRKIKSGEAHPKPEELADALRRSYQREFEIEDTLSKAHVFITRLLACGLLFGVALQLYIILRVKAAHQARNSEPA